MLEQTFENILLSTKDAVLTITVNRPEKLNALNKQTIEELHQALVYAQSDPEIRVVILTGSGDKAFVAGADIAEFANFNQRQGEQMARNSQQLLFDYVENLSKPVIAAINGFALGGGLELAMACHFRIASTNAKMGLPETTLGVIPGYGGTQRLPQLVGKGRAMQMILTAEMITADQAFDYGLINEIVLQQQLLEDCSNLAARIIKNSPLAVASAIRAINAYHKDNGFDVEIEAFAECFGTDDFKEGTTAFLDKRKPQFN